MEAYADGLVKFLLEFMRFLVTRVSGILMSWYESGFLDWVMRHWLTLVIILVVAGILVDQVVWFMRWRPYYSWIRTWRKLVNGFRQLGRKARDPSYRAGTQEQFSAQREEVLRKLALQDGKGGMSMSADGNGYAPEGSGGVGMSGARGAGGARSAAGAGGYGPNSAGTASSTPRTVGNGGSGGEARMPVSSVKRQQGMRPGPPAQGNRNGQPGQVNRSGQGEQANRSGQQAPRSPSYGRPSGTRDERGRDG